MKKLFYNVFLLFNIISFYTFTQPPKADTRGLLIFLDDSEKDKVGPISYALLAALESEAGPIIASAWLLNNVRPTEAPKTQKAQKLLDTYNRILSKELSKRTDEEEKEVRKILLSAISFNDEAAKKWVIKEINASLYLLLPKKYLKSMNVSPENADIASKMLTPHELILGLKVNHMKTVNISDIQQPSSQPTYASYFIEALPDIFVTNSEYSDKAAIPNWAIYLDGHGMIHNTVVQLSISQFKDFLTFLEKKLTQKFYIMFHVMLRE